MKQPIITRRAFLAGAVGTTTLRGVQTALPQSSPRKGNTPELDFPLVDYHAHLDQTTTLEKALEISRSRGVKFGIVEHAGSKENKYAGLLSTDEDLLRYIALLDRAPVFKGVQAEGLDWMKSFSRQVFAKLDYVLSDALTFPEKNGQRVELWRAGVQVGDPNDFMERYTDFNVQVMAQEPIDIIANPTFLPEVIEKDYEKLWTRARMMRIIDAAVKHAVAIEINSRYRLPSIAFLRLAKEAGAKFSFGSNIHGPDVGMLDYCMEMAGTLGLKRANMFTPAPPGKKPIEIRSFG